MRAASMPLALALCIASLGPAPGAAETWGARLEVRAAEAALRAPDAATRARAARWLGRYGRPERVGATLASALEVEGSAEVRAALVRALCRLGSDAAVPALAEHVGRQEEGTSSLAVEALASLGSPRAIQALVDALAEGRVARAEVEHAAKAVGRIGTPALPHLLRLLRSDTATPAVLSALAEIGSPFSTPYLLPLLESEDARIVQRALEALEASGDRRARAAIALRSGDPRPEVALAATRALARVGGPEDVTSLTSLVQRAEPGLGDAALRALLRLDPAAAVGPLGRAVADDDPLVARTATVAALDLPSGPLVPTLLALMGGAAAPEAVADALGRVPRGEGVEALTECASRPEPVGGACQRALAAAVRTHGRWLDARVVRSAFEQLRTVEDDGRGRTLRALARDPDVAPRLVEALGAEAPLDRAEAAHGLALLGDPHFAPELVAALTAEHSAEAAGPLAAAAAALGGRVPLGPLRRWMTDSTAAPEAMLLAARGAPQASPRSAEQMRESFRRALRHAEPRIRAGAARALAEANDRAAFRALIHAVDDPAPEVRRAAARALEMLAVPGARERLRARARVETVPAVRRALEDAARAPDVRRLGGFADVGSRVLSLRVAVQRPSDRVPVEIVLPDGRWLRLPTLPGGELFLADLPSGRADARVGIAYPPQRGRGGADRSPATR